MPSSTHHPFWRFSRKSIRARLLFGTLIWIAIALISTGIALSLLFDRHVNRQFERGLESHLIQLVANFELAPDGSGSIKHPPADPRFNKPFSGLYWQIDRNHETAILRSRSLWDEQLVVPTDKNNDKGNDIRFISGPQNEPSMLLSKEVKFSESPDVLWRISVASGIRSLQQAKEEWKESLTLYLGILFITLIFAAVAQVYLGLTPLRNLQNRLHLLTLGKANKLEGSFPTEIQPLIEEFNVILEQNKGMITKAQNRAGDLAHAMKTPLTVLANAAEMEASKNPSSSSLAKTVKEQVATLKSHIDQQLIRARSDAISVQTSKMTPVMPVIGQLVQVMKKIHADKYIRFDVVDPDDSISFPGDINALQEMLGNLLDNACKWTGTVVRIQAVSANGKIHILIEDDGNGVTDDQLAKITHRGVRLDERKPGSGLGLSIVSELSGIHRGSLRLFHSDLGGLGAELTFPEPVNVVSRMDHSG